MIPARYKKVIESNGKVRYLDMETSVLYDEIPSADAIIAEQKSQIVKLEERISQLEFLLKSNPQDQISKMENWLKKLPWVRQFSIKDENEAWAVNFKGIAYRWNIATGWIAMLSGCKCIAVGIDGTACYLSNDGQIFKYNGKGFWLVIPFKAQTSIKQICVHDAKEIWVVDNKNNAYKMTLEKNDFRMYPELHHIKIERNATILAESTNNEKYEYKRSLDSWEKIPK